MSPMRWGWSPPTLLCPRARCNGGKGGPSWAVHEKKRVRDEKRTPCFEGHSAAAEATSTSAEDTSAAAAAAAPPPQSTKCTPAAGHAIYALLPINRTRCLCLWQLVTTGNADHP